MDRKIKFRFWDGKKLSNSWSLEDLAYEGFPEQMVNEHGDVLTPDVMQYTGLKDKNGVEIYEGYVCEDSVGAKREVFWDKHGFWQKGKDKQKYWPNTCEVIGNIYENPELLN